MQEVQGRIEVATSERDMLLRKSEEAKVGPPRARRRAGPAGGRPRQAAAAGGGSEPSRAGA
jgi:hypothetical protein